MREGAWPRAHREWVGALPAHLPARKLRLLAGACCRMLLEPGLERERATGSGSGYAAHAVETALTASDTFADTGRTKAALQQAVKQVDSLRETHGAVLGAPALLALRTLLTREPGDALDQCALASQLLRSPGVEGLVSSLRHMVEDLSAPEGGDSLPDVAVFPSEVVELARSIYQQREFHRMPELADALEEAGCRDEGLLAHCRAADAVHLRGCRVLDGILGDRTAEPARPRPAPKRHRVLGRELAETRETTLSLLARADALSRDFTAAGRPHQQFARQIELEDTVCWAVLEHLGYQPPVDLASRLGAGVDRAVEYFFGEWWRADEEDARALDRSRPDRELAWYQVLPNALLLCGLTGRWDAAAQICSWFDASLQLQPRFELNDYEHQWLYLCILSALRPEPLEVLDVTGTLQALRECRPRRPRLLGALWESVLAGDQGSFDARLKESVSHFLKSTGPAPNPNFWVARDESLMWLVAERNGLSFPTLPEKLDAAVVRRQTLGLA